MSCRVYHPLWNITCSKEGVGWTLNTEFSIWKECSCCSWPHLWGQLVKGIWRRSYLVLWAWWSSPWWGKLPLCGHCEEGISTIESKPFETEAGVCQCTQNLQRVGVLEMRHLKTVDVGCLALCGGAGIPGAWLRSWQLCTRHPSLATNAASPRLCSLLALDKALQRTGAENPGHSLVQCYWNYFRLNKSFLLWQVHVTTHILWCSSRSSSILRASHIDRVLWCL